jgi:hypothetical protein
MILILRLLQENKGETGVLKEIFSAEAVLQIRKMLKTILHLCAMVTEAVLKQITQRTTWVSGVQKILNNKKNQR